MANPHGGFIWHELLTHDPDAAASFYGAVAGWTAQDAGQPGVDYRIFSAAGIGVAGHMALPPGAEAAGMKPGWLGYIGVDDVDAAVAAIVAAGGTVHMPAMDLANVGRMALVADPQGAPFYVMRGASDQSSTAFAPMRDGHCSWNELSTSDQGAALAFYAQQFGWTRGDVMPMGEMGDYQFVTHAGETIGAVMTRPPGGPPPRWAFYFRVPDIDAAAAAVGAGGGTIRHGPVEVPGGDFVIMGTDPQGVAFGVVGHRTGERK